MVAVINCREDPSVQNATYTLTEGLAHSSEVQYSCNNGYVCTAGCLIRTCHGNAWEGIAPVCSRNYALFKMKKNIRNYSSYLFLLSLNA